MDFTLKTYRALLSSLQSAGYQSVLRFGGQEQELLLRHDVDLRPRHALRIAKMEAEMGMRSIFYFRAVSQSWDESVILQILALGHEIGYHYESLTTCRGDIQAAYRDFCDNLQRLSTLIGRPVTSVCMHGSPKSPYDSRDLWQHYDYHALGIDYEPYFDTDFSKVFYLTDTGRRWDGYKVSIRDKVPQYQDQWVAQGLVFHSTSDLIRPNSPLSTLHSPLLVTTHPQRWMPFGLGWIRELVLQNAKNLVKRFLATKKS